MTETSLEERLKDIRKRLNYCKQWHPRIHNIEDATDIAFLLGAVDEFKEHCEKLLKENRQLRDYLKAADDIVKTLQR